jgi:hypothetical protein
MKRIIKGIVNHHTQGETELSEKRMSICKACPNSYDDVILGKRCRLCGCILKYKVKSDGSCPDGKW